MPLGCVGLIILIFVGGVVFWALRTTHLRKVKWAACEEICSPYSPYVYPVKYSPDPDQCWYMAAETLVKCGHPAPLLDPGSGEGRGG